ncbi:papilin-like [Saccostrea cucullata]|uniref:papilin-like n=1 Tax=Saccostrea cuccullata TaxID=36930 RepID=UPI002ED0CE13
MSRTRFRNCTNPKPAYGGKSCNGSGMNTESKSCNSNPCPVNGNWTSFGSFTDWTSCNVTCGGGITSRQQNRSCTNPIPAYEGKSCSGESVKIERKTCNTKPCPIDGKWTQFGQFTEWTPCNVTCGGGTMSRKQFRNCSNPEPAYGGEGCSGSGINIETKSCTSWPCPGYEQLTSTSAPNIEITTMISEEEKTHVTTVDAPIKKTMVTTLMAPVSTTTIDTTYINGFLGAKSNNSGAYKTTTPKNFHDSNEITTPVQESASKVDIQTEMNEENMQGNKSLEMEDPNNGFVLTTKQSPPDITTEQTIDSGFNASSTKSKEETTTDLPENLRVVSTPKPYGLTTVVYEKEYKSDKDNTRGNLTIVMNNNTLSYNTSNVETITTAEDNEKKPEDSATQSAIILPNNESGEVNLKTSTDSQQKTSLLTTTSSTTLPTNMVTNLSLDSSNVTSSQEKSNASNNKVTGETNIVTTLYNNSNFNNQTCKNFDVNQSDVAFTSSEYTGRNFSSIFSSEGIVLTPVNGTTLLNVIFASPLNISSLEAILINHEKVNVTLYDNVGKIIKEKVTEHNNYTAVISKIQISIFVHDPEEEISVSELRAVACVD